MRIYVYTGINTIYLTLRKIRHTIHEETTVELLLLLKSSPVENNSIYDMRSYDLIIIILETKNKHFFMLFVAKKVNSLTYLIQNKLYIEK